MPETPIDWDALKHEDGTVPWPAIDGAIAAITAHPGRWREVADALREDIHDENPKGYLCLYLPAILGAAAAAMMPETPERREIAGHLLAELLDAEVREEDLVIDALEFGSSRVGPWIVPIVLEQIRTPPGGESFGLWGLLDLATKSEDAALRERVARECLAKIEAEFAAGDLSTFLSSIWTLAQLRYTPALERLKKLGRDHRELIEQSHLRADFREAIRMLKGEQTKDTENYWDRGLNEYLDEEQARWRTWYEENAADHKPADADEEIGGGIDDEEAQRKAKDIAARFVQSSYAAGLSESPKKTENDVAMIVGYGSRFLVGGVGQWGKGDWAELLLQVLPAKVSADADWWKTVAPTLGAFLRWAALEGISPSGEALAKEIETWGPDIEENAANSDNWGMAKSLMMQAKAAGVEPGNQQQLDEFINRYNARLVGEGKQFEEDDDFEEDEEFEEDDGWEPQQPIRRESPKVGRNDPCPCGSGKKYKKCCGR